MNYLLEFAFGKRPNVLQKFIATTTFLFLLILQPISGTAHVPSVETTVADIIVLEGDLLIVEAGNEDVDLIQVFDSNNNKALEEDGCKSNSCEVSLKALTSGSYLVKVITSDGQQHTETIWLN